LELVTLEGVRRRYQFVDPLHSLHVVEGIPDPTGQEELCRSVLEKIDSTPCDVFEAVFASHPTNAD
jgi:hypothetical protein